jgi:hypothetical protein
MAGLDVNGLRMVPPQVEELAQMQDLPPTAAATLSGWTAVRGDSSTVRQLAHMDECFESRVNIDFVRVGTETAMFCVLLTKLKHR